jgi:hypothetical protein
VCVSGRIDEMRPSPIVWKKLSKFSWASSYVDTALLGYG